jgi:hypothetical protein
MRWLLVVALIGGCSRPSTPDSHADPWRTASIGSVYETKTVTRLEKPFAHETETTTKQTLLARTESEASIQLEVFEGSATSAQRIQVPLRRDELRPPHDGSTVSTVEESCTVPAGTFQCTKTTVEARQGVSSVTWTAKRVPVPLKSVVTNENMTITSELTRIAAR